MPKTFTVNGDVDIDTSSAERSLNRLERRIRQTGEAGAEAGATASEKFGELNSVFGGLLPRNIQSIIRRFQSTSRAVRRAGKSMDIFKKSLISLGLPALIILLGEVIANWEYISDLLGFTSEETRRLEAQQKKLNEELERATMATEPYRDILLDVANTAQVQDEALKQLGVTLREIQGLDRDSADLQDRVNEAIERNLKLVEKRSQLEALKEEYKAAQEERDREGSFLETVNGQKRRILAQSQRMRDIDAQREQVLKDILTLEGETTAEIERQRKEREDAAEAERERLEAEREAEAERKRREKEREDRLKREAEAVARRVKQEEQVSMSQEQLFLDELRRQEEAEMALVRSEEAKQSIREFYEEQRRKYYEEQWESEQARLNQEAEREQEDLARRTEQAQKAIDDATQKAWQERNMADMSDRERELMENELHYEKLLDGAELYGLDTTQLVEDRRLKEKAINDKYNAQEIEDEKKKQEALSQAKLRAVSEAASLVSDMGKLAEEGTAAAKGLAITEVLLNQAVAMSEAVKGANKAAAAGGPAAPFLQVGYMLSMVGGVVSSFASIKKILSDADAGGGAGSVGRSSGGGRTMASPLVPQQNFDVENNAAQSVNVSAYVVQSQLQGQQLDQASAMARATL